jgi:hypothetical protein
VAETRKMIDYKQPSPGFDNLRLSTNHNRIARFRKIKKARAHPVKINLQIRA